MSAHKWAEVIKAFADGELIQFNSPITKEWVDFSFHAHRGPWDADMFEWRIKPELWYRIARMDDGSLCTVETAKNEELIERSCSFGYWLTDRVYY